MNTALQQTFNPAYSKSTHRHSVWALFISWCSGQQKNHFLWLAAGLAGHGCFMTPLTLFAVMFSGNSILLFTMVTGAMGMTLATNLAALPTKITIPVLFLSILIDLGIILGSILTAFTIAG